MKTLSDDVISPIPDDIKFNFHHFEFGKPDKAFAYHNEKAQIIGYIARWNTSSGKEIRPICYTKKGWICKGFQKPWNLYNLHLVNKYSNLPVLICEGETSADAANLMFDNIIATTTMHGALSVNGTDFSTLKGRDIIICPDLDKAGAVFQNLVYQKCEEAEAKSIKLLDLKPIKNSLKAFDIKGFDLADAREKGWICNDINQLLTDFPFNPENVLPEGFFIKDNKNIHYEYAYKKQDVEEIGERFLCSYLVVKYRTRDSSGNNWGYLVEMIDPDNNVKELAISAKLLAGDGLELRELLLDNGLTLAPGSNKMLHQYFITSKPEKHIRCVSQTGWSDDDIYVLPSKIYKLANQEDIRLQRANAINITYNKKGTNWQEKIAKYAENNPNMIFVIALSLSAPLLHLTNTENIGIHFTGPSSIGKTTLLQIASSVWGNQIHNWRTTDNAAESIAELSNDGLLIFDELGQVDGFTADKLSYMLGNGQGKLRAKRSGEAKEVKLFRLVLLSSGENGLSVKLQEAKRKVKAGQSVRLIEIPANRKYGIFDDLHHFKSGDEFARYLKNEIKENQGTLIDEFLEKLIKNSQKITEMIKSFRKVWEDEVQNQFKELDGQVKRVIAKFSLIAACGEVAVLLKLLQFKSLEVSKACKTLLNTWITNRGGILPQEITEAVKSLQEFIEEHGSSRFENPWEKEGQIINNRAGFRKNEGELLQYYILPSTFNKIIGIANKLDVCRFLKEKDILETNSKNENAKSIKIPGLGQRRIYHINYSKLEVLV